MYLCFQCTVLLYFYISWAYILQFVTNIWCMSIVYSGLPFLSLGTIDFVYLCFLQIYIYIYFQLISCYVKLCIYIQLYIVFDITLLSLTLALFLLSTTILWLMFDLFSIFALLFWTNKCFLRNIYPYYIMSPLLFHCQWERYVIWLHYWSLSCNKCLLLLYDNIDHF